ncbi:MAG: SRPBCC family protein [Pyrinomonadaceae bacterium]
MQRTEKTIEIDAPVERVFDLFSDFESFPRWMRNIKEVRYTGRRYTRWTADAPLGSSVEWEAETTHFEPDHRIAWRTVRGDVDTSGEVIFEETRRGTTRMRVVLGYDPPAGRLGALVASLFGKNPETQLEEDLERFAAVVEGRRAPRRASSDGLRRRRETRDDDYYGRDRYAEHRARDYEEDDERYRERDRRRRFDDALREARRSQIEGQRRYREARERDERRRYDEHREREWEERRFAIEDDERRRGHDERWNEARRREAISRRPEDEDGREHAFRHPMTPREWERESARGRQPDHEYSKQAFRRGVDKLMDEPPSGRWRRWR